MLQHLFIFNDEQEIYDKKDCLKGLFSYYTHNAEGGMPNKREREKINSHSAKVIDYCFKERNSTLPSRALHVPQRPIFK